MFVGIQDGRSADVIHQPDVDFNEQEVITTQVMSHDGHVAQWPCRMMAMSHSGHVTQCPAL